MPKANSLGVVGPYPPYRGGIAQFTEQFHIHLAASAGEVTGVSFSRQYPGIFFPGKSQETSPSRGQIPAERLIDSVNPLSWISAANHLIAAKVEEVVFMHWMPFFAPCYGQMATRLRKAGIRVTAIVHNAKPHERQPFGEWLNRYFLSNCDRLIALSETVRRDIDAMGVGVSVTVSPHPTYSQFGEAISKIAARRQLRLKEEGEVILFFGLIRHYKGLDILLKAFGQAAITGRQLLIAGEWYEDQDVCNEIIEKYSIAHLITRTDAYVPDEEVHLYFSAADVAVQPYRTATQSGVVQTAFQFGCPVIVTGVGGLPEMVRHDEDALVLAPEDPAILARAIERFFLPGTPERLAAGARQARERFTWDTFIKHYSSNRN